MNYHFKSFESNWRVNQIRIGSVQMEIILNAFKLRKKENEKQREGCQRLLSPTEFQIKCINM